MSLLDEEYIGIDSEWKPSRGSKINRPAILQLGGSKCSFIIDMIALRNSNQLNEML